MPPIDSSVNRMVENVEQEIVGNRDSIQYRMIALLCDGHVLIEDVPGMGKTMLAQSVAIGLGGQFRWPQCTPDLFPTM